MMRAAVLHDEARAERAIRAPAGRVAPEDRSCEQLVPRRRGGSAHARREERPPTGRANRPAGVGGGRLTLASSVASAWEGLLAAGSAACPVCRDLMELDGVIGRCRGCGSRLE